MASEFTDTMTPNWPASGNGATTRLFRIGRLGRAVPEPVR